MKQIAYQIVGPYEIEITIEEGYLTELIINPQEKKPTKKTSVHTEVFNQLEAYFAQTLTTFNLPLMPKGTPFQHKVWTQLLNIPYGQTQSYQDVACHIKKPTAYRAVGLANGRNPIPIIIPCHRVITKDGKLGGYSGGTDIKEYLLSLENIRL